MWTSKVQRFHAIGKLSARNLAAEARSSQNLSISCSCGKVRCETSGQSVSNYYCHANSTRLASNLQSFVAVSTFKPEHLLWHGTPVASENIRDENIHLSCACAKKEYLGYDATETSGTVALNLEKADSFPSISPLHRPNAHYHYANRVVEMDDKLPKWTTIPEGNVVNEKDSKLPVQSGLPFKEVPDVGHVEWNSVTGQVFKDVLPISTSKPEPLIYTHTENDPPVNNFTKISPSKVEERLFRKYMSADPAAYVAPKKDKRDVIVIGGGHNGLVSAAYLAKAGLDTLVLERRHCVGGAAVTEEIIPGFKFSRASYLAGLLRPKIIEDLDLESHGFKYLPRNPSSFTPTKLDSIHKGKYLLLGEDEKANWNSVAQFSVKDADNLPRYEEFLGKIRDIMQPLLDHPPMDPCQGTLREKLHTLSGAKELIKVGCKHREVLVPFYELMTGPAQQILDRWFESDMVKTTLATDAVIGALVSPKQNGSAYVLLHHVMGEAAGKKGVWAYVEGGMGAISNAIAASAKKAGAEIVTNATVRRILTINNKVVGVKMDDGSEIHADTVLSGTSPYHTFLELMPGLARDTGHSETSPLPADFVHHIRNTDFSCGAFKINCAVDRLPNFTCFPSPSDGSVGPMHRGTIHFESRMEEIEAAYREASMGIPATRPVIEMTIPSSVDKTISPAGKHVVQLFVQFAPYDVDPKIGNWADPAFKNAFADRCLRIVDEFCPGFSSSVIGRDVLSPLDLERIFGMHKGNIFHGSLGIHQLGYARPMNGYANHRSPIEGLYMCASGTHPGGGVQGAPGRNCAHVVMFDKGVNLPRFNKKHH